LRREAWASRLTHFSALHAMLSGVTQALAEAGAVQRTAGLTVNLGHSLLDTIYLELHALAEMTAVTETGS
jgi:hypothetical protein